ncbi:MAG: thiamine phosphate synthase [Deltaproteobacteria bacterium]|nr:thiamine phosphate synthase [Deltaproteobacteria bacterium]
MQSPLALQITAFDQLPAPRLWERIAGLGALPPAQRSRFAVQLRDPGLPTGELLARGRELRARTQPVGAALVINDRLDVALALGADGVHLGRHSVAAEQARRLLGEEIWISMSAHSLADVDRAIAAGAQAALLSPIFSSPGKGSPLGIEALTEARALVPADRPFALIALGGVTAERAAACLAAGADGVASIRADLTAVLAG